MSRKSLLDRVEIPNPCFADWERMVGSKQIRFCEECNKHVYNLSAMPRGEAEALIASAPKGRLCARLTRDAEGITMTADDQPGMQLLWRRASPIANAVVSAILTMATPGVAGASQFETQRASITSAIARSDGSQASQGTGAVLSGTLLDPRQAVIQGGKIELINEDTGDVRTTTSSETGSFQFVVSSDSLYTLKAAATGFTSVSTSGLRPGQPIDIKLAPAFVTMGGAIALPVHPLRELYNDSDRIVVARVARSVRVPISVSGSRLVRTSLNVSSTLKGEGAEPVVNVYHFGDANQQSRFPEGENLLVFLKRGGAIRDLVSASGYELADYSRGIKKLSSSELNVYVQRINELEQLSHDEKPIQEELVEWLVRCAEDPVTRWEGAFELASSAANLRASCTQDDSDEETDSPEEAEEAEGDEPIEVDVAHQFAPGSKGLRDGATFAVLLTGDQKARLIKALLSTDEITEGDERLIDCVKDFRDPRLLPFLVSQLRRSQDNPPESATHVVQVIAELVADKRIDALARNYRDAPYDDEDEENENDDQDTAKTQVAVARERSAQMRLFLQQVDRITRGRNLKPVTP